MNQLLPRGRPVSTDKRIKLMIANGSVWQIYITNVDTYVLAVKHNLYRKWLDEFSLPEGIFNEDISPSCVVFLGSHNYLVSSLDKGPYPNNNGQVEAFSIAFFTAFSLFKDVDMHDAIYIEEYSLLLPVSSEKNTIDKKLVYGKWLTGGVYVSVDSINRVSSIMSWLPKESLLKSVQMAGFELYDETNDFNLSSAVNENLEEKSTEDKLSHVKRNRFTLIGKPDLAQFFNDNIIDIVLHQDQYKRMGISFPGATILFGPPGSGKTYAVEKLSEYLGWQRFDIDSSSIASSYIHATSKKISEVFQSAIKAAPSILVIDEMEAFLTSRGLAGLSGTHHIEEVAEFLRRIPEAISKGVLVFAMTNMIDLIDPAILRRGRFDHIIEVKMASSEEIEAFLKSVFEELPVDKSVKSKEIAEALAERPMSDVAFVIREAGRIAVKNGLNFMSKESFSEAINMLPKRKEYPKIGF